MSPTDEIPVLLQDLEQVQSVLEAAEGLVACHDLTTQFLAGTSKPRSSPLARSLRSAIERVDGYIAEASSE